jgi:hypothetical protein
MLSDLEVFDIHLQPEEIESIECIVGSSPKRHE